MAHIVGGYAASHSPLMLTSFGKADQDKANLVLSGFNYIKQQLDEQKPDVIIVISDDHFKSFFLDNMPMFCIGVHTCKWLMQYDWLLARIN